MSISSPFPYTELLRKYPNLTNLTRTRESPPHGIVHQIRTTGPGSVHWYRRLDPTKKRIAQTEFEHMMKLARPTANGHRLSICSRNQNPANDVLVVTTVSWILKPSLTGTPCHTSMTVSHVFTGWRFSRPSASYIHQIKLAPESLSEQTLTACKHTSRNAKSRTVSFTIQISANLYRSSAYVPFLFWYQVELQQVHEASPFGYLFKII